MTSATITQALGRARVFDLSQPLFSGCPRWSGYPPGVVETTWTIAKQGFNAEHLDIMTHTGTHLDVPYHFVEAGRQDRRRARRRVPGPSGRPRSAGHRPESVDRPGRAGSRRRPCRARRHRRAVHRLGREAKSRTCLHGAVAVRQRGRARGGCSIGERAPSRSTPSASADRRPRPAVPPTSRSWARASGSSRTSACLRK